MVLTKRGKRRHSGCSKAIRIRIPKYDIVRLMTIRQDIAAVKLGVSLSSLKRRYYELNLGRWPIYSSYILAPELHGVEKMYICNILGEEVEDERTINSLTIKVLQAAFMHEDA
jgi:hypothetical protein